MNVPSPIRGANCAARVATILAVVSSEREASQVGEGKKQKDRLDSRSRPDNDDLHFSRIICLRYDSAKRFL